MSSSDSERESMWTYLTIFLKLWDSSVEMLHYNVPTVQQLQAVDFLEA